MQQLWVVAFNGILQWGLVYDYLQYQLQGQLSLQLEFILKTDLIVENKLREKKINSIISFLSRVIWIQLKLFLRNVVFKADPREFSFG